MRDIFSEGLLYLDLLELYGSTYSVAEICGVAQSNVFRGATACAKLLSLDLVKDKKSGLYNIQKNHDVQRDLRRVNQRLRSRESGQLRVLSTFPLSIRLPNKSLPLLMDLPPVDVPLHERMNLIHSGVIDLLIVSNNEFSASLPWSPPTSRQDLFTPCHGSVASLIGTEPFVFLVSPHHHLAKLQRPLQLTDLLGHVFTLFTASNCSSWQRNLVQSVLSSDCPIAVDDLSSDTHFEFACYLDKVFESNDTSLTVFPNSFYQSLSFDEFSPNLLRLPTEFESSSAMVAIASPSLVREPLFKELMKALRDSYRSLEASYTK